MAEVRSHLADVIERARREETPTITTPRGKQEAVVIDVQEYQRLQPRHSAFGLARRLPLWARPLLGHDP
ncbi:type II toxin-antitoxin system Phd/YefM family antitoxin [Streptomyces sp. NPDC048279]|uniref:type II toxin-antitoxin system Phd/YefM family antitoxin n=1 Tax=Streptomyces sp. NPDC048279 TaxID=3154714 RepID=UPI00341971DB